MCQRIARFAAPAFLALLGLSGCKAQVKDLYHDPSFDYTSAVQNRVGIIGVTALAGQPSGVQEAQWGTDLSNAMRAERSSFAVSDTNVVRTRAGDPAIQALEDFRRNGDISAERLTQIKAKNPGFGYVMVARLERDDVDPVTSYEMIKELDNEVTVAKYSTRRAINVQAAVYDIREGRMVWRASRREEAEVQGQGNLQETDELFGNALAEGLASSWGLGDNHPAPPDLSSMMKTAFEAFAENMPEQEDD